MKTSNWIFLVFTTFFLSNNALGLDAVITDSAWDGKKVPDGQQCQRFGGNGSTPTIRASDIPAGTQAVILAFTDRSVQKMNNGGHGKIGMLVEEDSTEVEIPSVPGHSFELPDDVFLVSAQRNPSWDKAGAYMPPCSGGRGNNYVVMVQAVTIKNLEKKKFQRSTKST